ncbi:MAG: amidohydrolase family protein [bacterium]|nr:amidohydrolase family protein [bacterium]
MKVCLVLTFFFVLTGLVIAQPIVIRNATVIDLESGKKSPGKTIVIDGTAIKSVSAGRGHGVPRNARIVDARGGFVIPGLWDMHVHYFNNFSRVGTDNKEWYGPLFIANGVTGVRDMASDLEDRTKAKTWAEGIRNGEVGPRVVVGSNIIDGDPPFMPGMYPVKDAASARAAVRLMKEQGATYIKVYWNLSPESHAAIADEAKKLGIPFAGHVPFLVSAFTASDLGQKSIEHLTGIAETCSSKEDELRKKVWTPDVQKEVMATFDADKCRRLYRTFAKNGTYNVPTLVLHRGMQRYQDPTFRARPEFRYISGSELKEWEESPQLNREMTATEREKLFQELIEVVSQMNRAGVPLLAGTDNNIPFVVPGFDLHDELELFVAAGLSPLQALRTATLNPALYLNATDKFGSVSAGKTADIVILAADPTSDIRNTRKINAVVSNGNFLDRKDIDAILLRAKANPRK